MARCQVSVASASTVSGASESRRVVQLDVADALADDAPASSAGGFAAWKRSAAVGALALASRGLSSARRGGRIAKNAYDRWERRQSVAAHGDRLRLITASEPISQADGGDGGRTRGSKSKAVVDAFESYEYEALRSQLRYEAEAADAGRVDVDKIGELLMRGLEPILIGVSVGALGVLSNNVAVMLLNVKRDWTLGLLNYGADGVGALAATAAFPVFADCCSGNRSALTSVDLPSPHSPTMRSDSGLAPRGST